MKLFSRGRGGHGLQGVLNRSPLLAKRFLQHIREDLDL